MMVRATPAGLHCEAGGFHVDPIAPVPLAIVTHAHGDHLVEGAGRYVCTPATAVLLRRRLQEASVVEPLPY